MCRRGRGSHYVAHSGLRHLACTQVFVFLFFSAQFLPLGQVEFEHRCSETN